jgi:hypothetical protein
MGRFPLCTEESVVDRFYCTDLSLKYKIATEKYYQFSSMVKFVQQNWTK